MKPQPLSYVKITNEEEYDIAVRAFVKAGVFFNKIFCTYLDRDNDKATAVFYAETNQIISDNNHGFYKDDCKELTITQLQEYLDDSDSITSKYKVDDLLILDGDYNHHYKVVGFDGDAILVTYGSDRIQRTTEDSVTEHYRKVT